MKRVSIIVPVYNGEKYIERCLDSLTSQTYSNLEIIVINDGSTDSTLSKIKKYKQIKIIDKENSGVSSSRNFGIEKMTGDYVFFCDADDWLDEKAIEIAVLNIKGFEALRFGHYVATEGSVIKKVNDDDVFSDIDKVIENNDEIITNLLSNKTEGHLWNYLFDARIIKENDIRFNENLFYQEDVVFLLEYFLKIEKVRLLKEAYYYYYKNSNSVTQTLNGAIRNISSIYMVRNTIIDILEKNNKNYKDIVDQKFLNLLLMYFSEYQSKLSKKEYFNFFDRISDANKEYFKELLRTELNKKWKLFIVLLDNKRKYIFYIYVKLYFLVKGKLV